MKDDPGPTETLLGRARRWATARMRPPAAEAGGAPASPAARSDLPRVAPTDATVRAALSMVDDPELGLDIVNLGLVRGWLVEGDTLQARITMTSAACPVGPHIADTARGELAAAFPGYSVAVSLERDPPWRDADMSPQARAWLGHGGPGPDPTDGPVVDLRGGDRPSLLDAAFGSLAAGDAFVLVDDVDPRPQYHRLLEAHGPLFGWEFLERGPKLWRVRITRVVPG